jgi:hypothetical protein
MIIITVAAALSVAAAPVPEIHESDLVGTWVAVHRSLGGIGSIWTFRVGGQLEVNVGAIVDSWYRVEGDELVGPPSRTTAGAPLERHRFRVEGDTLHQERGANAELVCRRVGPTQPDDPPYVGVWALSIGGRPISAQMELTRDGLSKGRFPFPGSTVMGTYRLGDQTFALRPVPTDSAVEKHGRFRLADGLLVLTQPDGTQEDTYIRQDAGKEELRRAGVSYGGTPARLDAP